MAVRIQRWIEAQGFVSNPFEYWEADRELELSRYFVRPEWFDALRGDTQNPRSAVLFAPRGHGKSSHRLEIARICGGHASHPALIVSITEYDWLSANGPDGISSQRYIQYIVRQAVPMIADVLGKNSTRQATFAEDPRRLLSLYGLIRWADPHSKLLLEQRLMGRQFGLVVDQEVISDDMIAKMAAYYEHTEQAEILNALVQITKAAGYASVYVLVDRIDEDELTEHDADMAVRILQPLISNLHLIEFPGIAFKFFLPDLLQQAFQAEKVGRVGERVPDYTLKWSPADLCELLSRRLAFYSRIGTTSDTAKVSAFQDLCEGTTDVDARLVAAAQGSPRALILLAKRIIEAHCSVTNDAESKISAATLDEMLGAALVPAEPLAATNGIPLLSLHPAGYVYLDDHKTDIRLTKLEGKLLEFLWQNRERYVSTAEVKQALYGSAFRTSHALFKVVTRLREQLESGLPNSKNYIDLVDGRGYRLINVTEEPKTM